MTVKTTCGVALSTAIAYGVLWGDRLDYLGHYLAGFGATLILLALLTATKDSKFGWKTVVVAYVAIAIGSLAEATIFRIAIFDPMDMINQSLGAVVAAACVIEQRNSKPLRRAIALIGSGLLIGGFFFAFS